MMMLSVYDTKVAAFATPWFAPTLASALRMFGDECQRPESNLNRHPADFQLFVIGEFDEQSGEFKQALRQVAGAADFQEAQ